MSLAPQEIERLLADHFARQEDDACLRGVPLERYAAGELSAAERAELESHLRGCDACKAALRAFDEVAPLWEGPAPAATVSLAARLRAWLSGPRLLVPVAAAAIAVLGIILVPRPRDDAQLQAKGGFTLHVAAERNGHAFRLQEGARLQSGDRLGFFYSAARAGHLTILYSDNDGQLVRLFPALAAESAPIAAGSEVRVPDGALISPGTGCEWVIGLFTAYPLDAGLAEEVARRMWQARRGCRLGEAELEGGQVQVLGVQR